jgi:hypothetical protein
MWPKRNCNGDHNMNADAANALLDAFAHELAEKQRRWARGQHWVTSLELAAADHVADLIDPEKEGSDGR